MKIRVKLIPGAKKKGLTIIKDLLTGEDIYVIKIHAKPINGEANKALINLLSDYFNTPRRNICILQGFTSRRKILKVND